MNAAFTHFFINLQRWIFLYSHVAFDNLQDEKERGKLGFSKFFR